MRNHRLNYTIVGSFVLLVAAGIVIAVVLLSGRSGPTERFDTVYSNVNGLKYGTQVLFEGYPIGQVERIEPFQDAGRMRFRVEFSVRRGWPIPADSIAQVTASGLLSAMTIDIHAGDSPQPLPPGGRLVGGEAADLFAAMSSVAAEMTSLSEHIVKPFMRQLGGTIGQFGDLLASDGSALAGGMRRLVDDLNTRIPQITGGVHQLVGELNDRVPEITARLSGFTEQLEIAGRRLRGLLHDRNLARVDTILANLEATSSGFYGLLTSLQQTRAELDALLAELHGVVKTSGPEVNRTTLELEHVVRALASHIDAISANAATASRNLNEFSREIRQNPSLLLGSKPLPDEARP
jgi:phospholipid/cholesterol/gamma-HCH transport system substrate-binding protein